MTPEVNVDFEALIPGIAASDVELIVCLAKLATDDDPEGTTLRSALDEAGGRPNATARFLCDSNRSGSPSWRRALGVAQAVHASGLLWRITANPQLKNISDSVYPLGNDLQLAIDRDPVVRARARARRPAPNEAGLFLHMQNAILARVVLFAAHPLKESEDKE